MTDRPAISVYDGQTLLGRVVEHGRRQHVAQDADGKRLGSYPTRPEAVAAVKAAAGGRP